MPQPGWVVEAERRQLCKRHSVCRNSSGGLDAQRLPTAPWAKCSDLAPQRVRCASPCRGLKPQLLLWRQRRNVGRNQLRCHILEPRWGPLGPTILVDDERAHPLDELAVLKQAHA